MKVNKNNIILLILAVLTLTAQTAEGKSKTFKTIKQPEAMVCCNVHNGDLKAREVIMRDTATTVRFTMEYPTGQNFRFASDSYLMDEDGNRYPLRSAEGMELDKWVQSPESGRIDFTMHFEPMPKRVQVFDYIEGDGSGAFMVLGIHDSKTKLRFPTLKELSETNPYMVPADWFKTDTITVRGRIEDYDADRFGFNSMECYFEDVFEKDDATLVLDINADGTFEKKFLASYPVQQTFGVMNSKVGFDRIPFFARPGEVIDITVRKNEHGQYECFYNSGSSHDVERWLKSKDSIGGMASGLRSFKGNFSEINKKAETTWQNLLYQLGTISRRHHFTPMEMQLALADMQVEFAYALMDYAMYREMALTKQEERDGVYHTEILDSVELNALRDSKNYEPLHRIDFDNPLLMACDDYPITLNRIQYCQPVRKRQYESMIDENGDYEYNAESEKRSLRNMQTALSELMGSDSSNIMAQLCAYKDMLNNFNYWRSNEEASSSILADTTRTISEREKAIASLQSLTNMMPVYLAAFSHPYIRQKAEQFYAAKMAQKELSTPLPTDNAAADLIRRLSAKYPGRFLMIDFWGMGCGPCRSAIQSSKAKRAEIAKRDDIKLIFIAGERTAEGSDAYKKYVAEWLADEETVCITNGDFTRLQELFRFNGIPHYETITPDCRRVRDDLRLNGFYNFDYELRQLKERMTVSVLDDDE